jgi:hypothetical protein
VVTGPSASAPATLGLSLARHGQRVARRLLTTRTTFVTGQPRRSVKGPIAEASALSGWGGISAMYRATPCLSWCSARPEASRSVCCSLVISHDCSAEKARRSPLNSR